MAIQGIQTGRATLFLFVLGWLGILIAAGSTTQANAAGPCNKWGDKTSNEITTGEARKAIFCLLNRERQARGISKLDRNRRLQSASQRHNDYMQRHSCFSHRCPGEASLTKRLKRAGWLTGGLKRSSYGENIAVWEGQAGTPEALVDAWMGNAAHRENILNRTFDEVGVGYSKGTITSKSTIGSVATTDFGFKVG